MQASPPVALARWTRLGARRRLYNDDATMQYNAAKVRRRNDVARCSVIDTPPNGPLCTNMTSSVNRKYIRYRNAARGGPSHGIAQKFGKVRTCTVRDRVVPEMGSRRDRQTRTVGVTTNHTLILVGRVPSNFGEHGEVFGILQLFGGSVAEWLACWTQAQKGPGSNRSHAVG